MERLASLSVDLDEVHCYAAIHGLAGLSESRAIYQHAIPRFEELFDELGVKATFFAVGLDIDELGAPILARLSAAGHEIASHSHSHRYDLTRASRAEIEIEVDRAAQRILQATGVAPVGFRSPGYTTSDELLEVLAQRGYAYDSSVFPCPWYYSAKAAAISLYGIRAKLGTGRASASIVDDPRVLSAPADPYPIGTPYWRAARDGALLELPIGVTRGARLPFIGTSVVLAGEAGASALALQMVGRPLVNLELHGIDLADAELDGLQQLRGKQPDLARSAEQKRRALVSAVRRLRASGYRFVTLAEAASRFSA